MAASPYEVLLYEDFDYKISFHTKKEKEAWKKVKEEELLHDDTVQHKDFLVGQIDDFPKETCANLNKIKMRLEPIGNKVHPKKSLYSDEGVNFTERIKRCATVTPKIANSIYISSGVAVLLAIILYTGKHSWKR